jgi:hypothetical protein
MTQNKNEILDTLLSASLDEIDVYMENFRINHIPSELEQYVKNTT